MARPTIASTRPPLPPHREEAQLLVAGWWHEATRGHHQTIAEHLEMSPQAIARYGDASLRLPMFDVVAAPSAIGRRVLRQAIQHVEVKPQGPDDLIVDEAVALVCHAGNLAALVRACSLEAMDVRALRRVLDLIDRAMDGLAVMRVRVVRVLNKRKGGVR